MKRLLHWIFPGGFLLALAWALKAGVGPDGLAENAAAGYPWVVYGVVGLLAAFFHRSRVVVATGGLALVAWAAGFGSESSTALLSSGVLFALSLGVLAVLRDRGIFSTPGLTQLGVAVVVALFGVLFVSMAPQDMAEFLAATPLPPEWAAWSGLPQPVLLTLGLALPVSLITALVRNGPVERGVFWSLVLLGLALSSGEEPLMAELFLMAAGLTLGLSVVETSYAMAYRDDLTGLPARRALVRDLEGLGGLFTAAMVDVDHFKKFNDKHGHDVGDQVLRMVATQLSKTPGGCRAYRYGGEEFTLLFSGKARKDTLGHLEVARANVEEANFTLRHWRRPRRKPVDPGGWKFAEARKPKRLSVTVSIGVADSIGSEGLPEEVLKKADRALYRAKRGGRNRVAK